MNKLGSFAVSYPIRGNRLKEVMIFKGDSLIGIQVRMFFGTQADVQE
jgi:hypothetical protein